MKTHFFTIFLVFVCFQMVQAQTENYLLYKEYAPDYWVELTPEEHFDIDINDDGNADVRYEVFWGHISVISHVITCNEWLACSYCTFEIGHEDVFSDLSIPLNDSSLVWGVSCHFVSLVQDPSTTPLVYKVALRLRDGETYYYGWAEFQEIRDANHERGRFHVVRTCYCTIPNYPLRWGQTSLDTDVNEQAATTFATLHPNPTSGLVTITGQDLKTAEVFNALGQCVVATTGEGERLTVDLSGLPVGVYFVNIADKEGRKCVRKVVKE